MLPILVLALIIGSSDAGVSFVRWGRTTCPTGTILLHKGFMSGSHYASGGEGVNFVCLHDSPKFVRPVPGRQAWTSYIWGVEMEFGAGSQESTLFLNDNIPGGNTVQQDVPCVRCYVEGSTDQFVMGGRPDCGSTGYDLMYSGFLVSQANADRRRSEYVCLDEAPEGIVGGSGDNNQGVIYPVQVGCGSLPCNPYIDGYEVTCAVCTY